jgi:hypothetical protein
MIPGVSITLANGNIGGTINTNDGVVGQVLTGMGTGALALLTPIKVVSLADAIAKGVTKTVEPIAYKFCKEFYDVAPLGAVLYLMLVANTASVESLCDKTNASGAIKLINFAQGAIRVLGVSRTPAVGYTPATPGFIDSDVISALPNAKALRQQCFDNHIPLRIALAARVADVSNATIVTPNTQDNNAVFLVVGDTLNAGGVAMGEILGKVAASPVHRNIGRNKDGALPVTSLYIGNVPVESFAQLNVLIDAGYLTFTTYPQKAGYYISDDPMCTDSATDDYSSLANCRVIDKASIIAYQTYIDELKDDVDLDANGNVDPVVIKHLEGLIKNNIALSMGDNISGKPIVFIDPAQNLAAGAKLKISIRLIPKGYLRQINIELGFTNPANAAI